MSLNPYITKESGVYWLNWTPDPTAEGYAFTTPTGKGRTFDPSKSRAKLGSNLTEPVVASVSVLDVSARASETASFPVDPDPDPTPVMGAKLYAAFPPLVNPQVIDYQGATRTSGKSFDNAKNQIHKNFVCDNAKPIAWKLNTCSNFEVTDGIIEDMPGSNAQYGFQAFHVAHGCDNIRIRRVISRNIGGPNGDKLSHAMYVDKATRVLIESYLAIQGISGEVLQFYPNNSVSTVVNSTFGRSVLQEAIVVWADSGVADVTVWNSIIDGDIQVNKSFVLRLRGTCCVTGRIPSGVDTSGATIIKESPGFDAYFKPTNPKLISSGDPDWTPYLDVYRNPFTKATVGAVAA